MQITVKLFASLRELAGASDLEAQFEGDSVSVAECTQHIADRVPVLKPYLERVAVAVNEEYVPDRSVLLHDGDVVEIVHFVGGG